MVDEDYLMFIGMALLLVLLANIHIQNGGIFKAAVTDVFAGLTLIVARVCRKLE